MVVERASRHELVDDDTVLGGDTFAEKVDHVRVVSSGQRCGLCHELGFSLCVPYLLKLCSSDLMYYRNQNTKEFLLLAQRRRKKTLGFLKISDLDLIETW